MSVQPDRPRASCRISPSTPIEDAIRDIAAGRAVVVVDDEDRENEGDLIFAASKPTPSWWAS